MAAGPAYASVGTGQGAGGEALPEALAQARAQMAGCTASALIDLDAGFALCSHPRLAEAPAAALAAAAVELFGASALAGSGEAAARDALIVTPGGLDILMKVSGVVEMAFHARFGAEVAPADALSAARAQVERLSAATLF